MIPKKPNSIMVLAMALVTISSSSALAQRTCNTGAHIGGVTSQLGGAGVSVVVSFWAGAKGALIGKVVGAALCGVAGAVAVATWGAGTPVAVISCSAVAAIGSGVGAVGGAMVGSRVGKFVGNAGEQASKSLFDSSDCRMDTTVKVVTTVTTAGLRIIGGNVMESVNPLEFTTIPEVFSSLDDANEIAKSAKDVSEIIEAGIYVYSDLRNANEGHEYVELGVDTYALSKEASEVIIKIIP